MSYFIATNRSSPIVISFGSNSFIKIHLFKIRKEDGKIEVLINSFFFF